MNKEVKRGQIYYADLSPARGSEQSGLRPVLIVSNDIGNKCSPIAIVAPITTATKHKLPTHIKLDSVAVYGIVLLEQIRTIDKSRLTKYICNITEEQQNEINKALKISLNLGE